MGMYHVRWLLHHVRRVCAMLDGVVNHVRLGVYRVRWGVYHVRWGVYHVRWGVYHVRL